MEKLWNFFSGDLYEPCEMADLGSIIDYPVLVSRLSSTISVHKNTKHKVF